MLSLFSPTDMSKYSQHFTASDDKWMNEAYDKAEDKINKVDKQSKDEEVDVKVFAALLDKEEERNSGKKKKHQHDNQ